MVDQKSFSALVLVSALTLAAPLLHPSNRDIGALDHELRASLDVRTLPARAAVFAHDMNAFFETQGYDLAAAQLWAETGVSDLGTESAWAIAPAVPPHPAHTASSATS